MRDIAKMCVASFIGAAIAMGVGALLSSRAKPADRQDPSGVQNEVAARRFVLVDDSGNKIGSLSNVDGYATLMLRNLGANPGNITLTMKEEGGVIYVRSKGGQSLIGISADEKGCLTTHHTGNTHMQIATQERFGGVRVSNGKAVGSFLYASEKNSSVGCTGPSGKEKSLTSPK